MFVVWFYRAQENAFPGAFLRFAIVYLMGCGAKDATEQVVTLFQKQKHLLPTDSLCLAEK